MNSGSSASIHSGGQTGRSAASASASHRSRPVCIGTSAPVRFTTSWVCTPGTLANASSAMAFSGIDFAPRRPSSAVTSTRASASTRRSASACAEKPAKTTL